MQRLVDDLASILYRILHSSLVIPWAWLHRER